MKETNQRSVATPCAPYFDPAWMRILADVHGILDVTADFAGCRLPLGLVKSRIFGNRLISAPFADYGGPFCPDERVADDLVRTTLEIAKGFGLDYVEIRAPLFSKALERAGFERRDDYVTFQLDLSAGPQALWKNLEKRTRNGITHGQKQNLHFRRAGDADGVRTFYPLYTKTMKSLGSPPQPRRFFEALWDAFSPDRMRLYLAQTQALPGATGPAVRPSLPVAAMLLFTHADDVHYAYSCSDSEHRTLRASDALLWHVIESLSLEGFRTFDFGRTRPGSGVYDYKQGWGGREVPMPYYYKFFGQKMRQRDEVRYARLARIWRDHLPKSVADRIGPWIIKQIG